MANDARATDLLAAAPAGQRNSKNTVINRDGDKVSTGLHPPTAARAAGQLPRHPESGVQLPGTALGAHSLDLGVKLAGLGGRVSRAHLEQGRARSPPCRGQRGRRSRGNGGTRPASPAPHPEDGTGCLASQVSCRRASPQPRAPRGWASAPTRGRVPELTGGQRDTYPPRPGEH